MGVFLGSDGCIELKRTSLDEPFLAEIDPSDVNVRYTEAVDQTPPADPHNVSAIFESSRFSFDFPHGNYISGDLLEFQTTDGSLIPFLDGWNQPYRTAWALCEAMTPGDYTFSDCDNGTDSICTDAPTYADPPWDPGTADYDNADVWVRDQINVDFTKTMPEVYDQMSFYVHVDEAGGITLYDTFSKAVSGEEASTVILRKPYAPVFVNVMVTNNRFRVIGQVQSFTVNTEREAVDVTELGDAFRERYSSLITGSGSITCLFEYEQRDCDGFLGAFPMGVEMPVYLNQLILRSSIGSEFFAKLVLVKRGPKPGGSNIDIDDRIWYEFEALITNVGMAFTPGEPVRVTVNYVSTGPIQLHTQMTSDYILQEQDPTKTGRIGFEEYSEDGFLLHV